MFSFLLCSRFTQDCVENLFSFIRAKNPTPNAKEFKRCLKLVAMSQYISGKDSHSYHTDDSMFLTDLGDTSFQRPEESEEIVYEDISLEISKISFLEKTSLIHLGGYCMHKEFNRRKPCKECSSFFTIDFDTYSPLNLLSKEKSFSENSLIYCSEASISLFEVANLVFERFENNICKLNKPIDVISSAIMVRLSENHIPSCHPEIVTNIVRRFCNCKLYFYCKDKNMLLESEKKCISAINASKSIKMRALIN
eukprot:TRINITY_DN11393_c0_g1_i1.p1 TRINITY_DN11393_c0_g1~~TRINITY_DN11393_c0_g1_i1.p1  ORF type:complete len:252 (-),score=-48.11 TRINITY_DN11393_c0_g1_i1:19-774(-)